MAKKRTPQERNLIFFNSSTKPNHKDQFIKAKIDNGQHNSKYRFCEEKDETVNHVIIEYSKLAQKEYKTMHD